MPTFSTIALERLIEPGAYKFVDDSHSVSESSPLSNPKQLSENVSPNMEKKKNSSSMERKPSRPQLTPALYAIPDSTPLPDCPSSFPPSPYIFNFKRRGSRPVSSCEIDSASNKNGAVTDGPQDHEKVELIQPHDNNVEELRVNEAHCVKEEADNSTGSMLDSNKDREEDDFFDPQESMSCASNTDVEDSLFGSVSKVPGSARTAEFFDAWDDISSESSQTPLLRNFEAELSEAKINMLAEIERRKQVEEALFIMRDQWQKMREKLNLVGISLPAFPYDINIERELIQQVDVTRFVANCVGRGTAVAEMEREMEAKLENKNFEISRLMDRLHYYEAMNREMSQRNQEVAEVARRNRLLGKRRKRWMWGGIAAAITVGSAALVWSYMGPPIHSSSSNSSSTVFTRQLSS